MKKLLLLTAIAVFGFTSVNAQDVSFGLTAGFHSLSPAGDLDGDAESESGFYIGGVADFAISDEFHVQPEVVYSAVEDFTSIQVPIMAKYYVAEGISLQAGPQIGYIMEDLDDDFSALQLGLGIGAGYDINENFFVVRQSLFKQNVCPVIIIQPWN